MKLHEMKIFRLYSCNAVMVMVKLKTDIEFCFKRSKYFKKVNGDITGFCF